MKKMKQIIILILLSIGTMVQAKSIGCWMPESQSGLVKNHYNGKDGGYVLVRTYRWHGRGEVPDKEYQLRLKGTYDWRGYFVPFGFTTKRSYQRGHYREVQDGYPIIKEIAEKYWNIPTSPRWPSILLPKKDLYPCYNSSISDKEFEKWKESPVAK